MANSLNKEIAERRRKLTEIFYKRFYQLIKENPKLRKFLTEREIEEGLQTLVSKIVEKIMEKEQKIGRKLTIEEIKEVVMSILNELAPTNYIG